MAELAAEPLAILFSRIVIPDRSGSWARRHLQRNVAAYFP